MNIGANRVTLRLGKQLDARLRAIAFEQHLNISQICRIMLEAGVASIQGKETSVAITNALRTEVATEIYAALEEQMRRAIFKLKEESNGA